jgi:hypothetical protein
MKLHGLWQDNITCLISDYFQCWTDSVEKLREIIFSHHDLNQHLLSQMCMTDGVTYEDMIPVLQEMLQSGAEADTADDGHSSDANTQIVTDITSVASQHESFFSLAPADNAPITNVPHRMPFPSMSPDEM